jgi:hypothetical protein
VEVLLHFTVLIRGAALTLCILNCSSCLFSHTGLLLALHHQKNSQTLT